MNNIQKNKPENYILPGALAASGTSTEDVLNEMGFSYTGQKWAHIPSVTARYIMSCIVVVRYQESLYLYNHATGIYEQVNDYNLCSAIRTIVDQREDEGVNIWSKGLNNSLEYELRPFIDNIVLNFNTTPYLIFKNTAYNTKTFKAVDFNMNQLCTRSIDYDYDAEATCPRFTQFIEEITCGDNELAHQIQQVMGYMLVNHNKAEKSFIFVGPARNGKSTLASVMKAMLGEGNTSSTPLKNIGSQFGLEDLVGKMANITTESDRDEKISTSTWKAITSNDAVTVNPKGKKMYSTKLNIKLVSFLNYYPYFEEIDEAIRRRLLILPMTAQIPNDKIDPDLTKKLLNERAGILNWALEGLKSLAENNWVFDSSKSSASLLETFITESDPILKYISECIEEVPVTTDSIRTSDIHSDFNKWALRNGYEAVHRGFKDEFKKKLTTAGITFSKVSKQGYECLKGITFRNNHEKEQSESPFSLLA